MIVDPNTPPADRQEMSLYFDGQVINFRYYSNEQDETTGRLKWVYRDSKNYPYFEFECTVDAETGCVVGIFHNLMRSIDVRIEISELQSFFAQCFVESGLNPAYLHKVEYKLNYQTPPDKDADTATVTIPLNEEGDRIEWYISKVNGLRISRVTVKTEDISRSQAELTGSYPPQWT